MIAIFPRITYNPAFIKYYYNTSISIGQGFHKKNIRKIATFFIKTAKFRIF